MQRLALVVFQYASHYLAVEARHVLAMGQLNQLLSKQQRLIELDGVFGVQLNNADAQKTATHLASPQFALELRVQQENAILALDSEAQLVELSAACIWPLPPLLHQAKRHPSIAALALHNDQIITLLNVEHLAA